MKTLCWIGAAVLAIVSAILWRSNAELRRNIDAGNQKLVVLSSDAHSRTVVPGGGSGPALELPTSLDPKDAASRALAIRDGETLLDILQDWSRTNPDTALEWFRQNDSKQEFAGSGRVDAIRNSYAAILTGMMAVDPARAIKLIAAIDPNVGQAVVYHFAIRNTRPGELDQFIRQLGMNPDTELRYLGFRYMAVALGQTSRFKDARALLEKAGDLTAHDLNGLTLGFAQNLKLESFNERQELANWIAATSPTESTNRNVGWFVERWANVNFDEVATWLESQSDPSWKDHAVAAFAKKARSVDQERAQDWARTINDEVLRNEVMTSLAQEELLDW